MNLGHIMFSFDGRINRGKFWLGYLLGGLLTSILAIVAMAMVPWEQVVSVGADGQLALDAEGNPVTDFSKIGLVPILMFAGAIILSLWIGFATMVKRCHDRGYSGWMSLIAFIPLVGFIWMLIALGIMEGEKGPNKWGPNPLGNQA